MTNLVYQSYIAETIPEWVNISTDSLKCYADKYNADYIFTRNVKLPGFDAKKRMHTFYNILNIIYNDWYDQYDDIFYVDCDIIADKDADSIFEIEKSKYIDIIAVPERNIQGASFGPAFTVASSTDAKEFTKQYKKFGVDILLNGKRKQINQYNTGVVLFTKKGRKKFRDSVPYDNWLAWAEAPRPSVANDQPYLNAMWDLYKFNIISLGDEWNMPATWFKYIPCPKSHFYHFSGGSSKPYMQFFSSALTPEGYSFDLKTNNMQETPFPVKS